MFCPLLSGKRVDLQTAHTSRLVTTMEDPCVDRGEQVVEELAQDMPDLKLFMDDGYAVLAGGAAAACTKPSGCKAVVVEAEAASSAARAGRCESETVMAAAKTLLMLGGGKLEALSEASGSKGALETVHVVGMAGQDAAHELGGDCGSGGLKELGTASFDQLVGFKAGLAITPALVEPLEANACPTPEVQSRQEVKGDHPGTMTPCQDDNINGCQRPCVDPEVVIPRKFDQIRDMLFALADEPEWFISLMAFEVGWYDLDGNRFDARASVWRDGDGDGERRETPSIGMNPSWTLTSPSPSRHTEVLTLSRVPSPSYQPTSNSIRDRNHSGSSANANSMSFIKLNGEVAGMTISPFSLVMYILFALADGPQLFLSLFEFGVAWHNGDDTRRDVRGQVWRDDDGKNHTDDDEPDEQTAATTTIVTPADEGQLCVVSLARAMTDSKDVLPEGVAPMANTGARPRTSTTLCPTGGVDAVSLYSPSVTAADKTTSGDKDAEGAGTRTEPEPGVAEGGAAGTTPEVAIGPVGLGSHNELALLKEGTGMLSEPESGGQEGGAAATTPEVPKGLGSHDDLKLLEEGTGMRAEPEPGVAGGGAAGTMPEVAIGPVGLGSHDDMALLKEGTGMPPEPESGGQEGGAAVTTPEAAIGPVGVGLLEPGVDASSAKASPSVLAEAVTMNSAAGEVESSRGVEGGGEWGYVDGKISDMNKVMEGWNGKQVTDALLWAKRYASVAAVTTSPEKAPDHQHGKTGPHPGREKPGEHQKEDPVKRAREIEELGRIFVRLDRLERWHFMVWFADVSRAVNEAAEALVRKEDAETRDSRGGEHEARQEGVAAGFCFCPKGSVTRSNGTTQRFNFGAGISSGTASSGAFVFDHGKFETARSATSHRERKARRPQKISGGRRWTIASAVLSASFEAEGIHPASLVNASRPMWGCIQEALDKSDNPPSPT